MMSNVYLQRFETCYMLSQDTPFAGIAASRVKGKVREEEGLPGFEILAAQKSRGLFFGAIRLRVYRTLLHIGSQAK
ncbi:MAG: hypothetical protein ABJC33_08735 [Betaproteobacteria bacterium]